MNEQAELVSKHLQYLAEVGQEDPDKIAQYLMEQQCRGYRLSAKRCPVATYLEKQTGVNRHRVHCIQTMADVKDLESAVINPFVVQQFILRFDGRMYPELDAAR